MSNQLDEDPEKMKVEFDLKGEEDQISFEYIKGSQFRTFHADGVFGAINPKLNLQFYFWNERIPIPRKMVHKLTLDGTLGDEIPELREQRDSLIRELDMSLVMDYDTATDLRDWLNELISQHDKLIPIPAKTEG